MTCHMKYTILCFTVPARIGRGGLTLEQDACELQRPKEDKGMLQVSMLSNAVTNPREGRRGGERGEGGRGTRDGKERGREEEEGRRKRKGEGIRGRREKRREKEGKGEENMRGKIQIH